LWEVVGVVDILAGVAEQEDFARERGYPLRRVLIIRLLLVLAGRVKILLLVVMLDQIQYLAPLPLLEAVAAGRIHRRVILILAKEVMGDLVAEVH
jgi:hypothetical protein